MNTDIIKPLNSCCSNNSSVITAHCDDVTIKNRTARIWITPNTSYKNRRVICRLLKLRFKIKANDFDVIKTEIE